MLYIEKESILKELDNTIDKCKEDPITDVDVADVISAIMMFIENMQAADVLPVRHGKWQQDGKTHKRCSNCKQLLVPNLKSNLYRYCPNCGAKMKGDEKMTTLYTFTVHYKFDNDKEVNALQHTIISEGNYEQAAQECLKVVSDMLDEFGAAPVDITLRGSETLEN